MKYNNKLTIHIDMDQVLCDLVTPWLKWINSNINTKYTMDDVDKWNLQYLVPTKINFNVYEYLTLPNTFINLLPIQDSISILNKLHESDHKIIFSTTIKNDDNYTSIKNQKFNWLEEHIEWFNPYLHFNPVHIKNNLNGNILFDDYTNNLNTFNGLGIAMSYKYNSDWQGLKVNNWNEFYNLIEYIETQI